MQDTKNPKRRRATSVDQLPANPLRMPPPYWRGSGATFQLVDALSVLVELLGDLPEIHTRTGKEIDGHFRRFPTARASKSDEAMEEFGNICDELWELEHRIILKTQQALLMTAIQVEELVNRFCVFNLPRELVETLERLSPADKLTAAASALGRRKVRGTAACAAITGLMGWRNAFAHGHCIDRPLKTLRHNHLISPEEYPGVPDSIALMLKLTAGYTRAAEYVARISVNAYTRGVDAHWQEALSLLRAVERYRFTGGPSVYEVTVEAA
jgi:hypothetical protein